MGLYAHPGWLNKTRAEIEYVRLLFYDMQTGFYVPVEFL